MLNLNKPCYYSFVLSLFAIAVLAGNGFASSGLNSAADEALKVRTAWSADRARSGDSILLAIVVDINKGFHINADDRQIKAFEDFKPIPTKLTVIEAPDEITIEVPRYPKAPCWGYTAFQ